MDSSHRLAFAFALALGATAAGCSSAEPSQMPGGSGGGDDDGGGDGSGAPSQQPLDPTGMYTMHSTFDIAANMPGTAGTVIRGLRDASGDPTTWILDLLVAQAPQSTQGALGIAATLAASLINDELARIAPNFVTKVQQVADGITTIATQFELDERFAISGAAGSFTATHTVVGVHYQFANLDGDFLLASYGLPDIAVDSIPVAMDATGQLTIAAHNVPVAYGKLIRLGLDAAVIPLIDSSAHNLNDLLAHLVDCAAVGAAVDNAIVSIIGLDFGAGLFTTACKAGLNAAATAAYGEIAAIDSSALAFAINGSARAVDRDNDRKIDEIDSGTWAGMLSYGSTPTQLTPAAFDAVKQ